MPPNDPLLTLTGRLRDEFSRWELLGRGQKVWDRPVRTEPYFVPFAYHGEFLRRQGRPDEGRRDGLMGSLFRRLREPVPNLPAVGDPLAIVDQGEAPDAIRQAATYGLLEAVWMLPSSVAWKPDSFEPFLYCLGGAEHPLCFEIVACGGRLHLQWAVCPDDRGVLSEAVAQLPFSSSLEWRDNHLPALLSEASLPFLWSRELALEREFTFPIRHDLPTDPLAGLLRAMTRTGPNAVAVVQVRFQPCVERWAESLWRLVTAEDGKKPFFEDNRPILDAVKEKCRKPFFAVTVRLSVLGKAEDEVDDIGQRLIATFRRYEGPNSLVPSTDRQRSNQEVLSEIAERTSRRSGMILNGNELLVLVHPPSGGTGDPALQRLRRKTWPAPPCVGTGFDIALGTSSHGGGSSLCGLRTSERLRHTHVLGGSGTGKSTFLLNSILQDLEAGNGVAVLDPHGDLVDSVLDRIPENRIGDVVLVDLSDAEWPVGFNILRAHNDIERNLLASDFVAIFERLSTSWGDQMTAVLGNAAMAFLASDEGGTLMDLKRFLVEKPFRDRFLRTVKDSEIRYFWSREFPLMRGTTQASLLTRLNGFLRHRLVRNMVAQRGERFDVGRMMDEGKIILAKLSQGLIGQENSWLLGSLLVSRIHQAALSRQAVDESRRRPFFLYLDEAHSFITPSIAGILAGARKYGLGLVLAHQELDQFPTRESGILSSILSNCHTRVYFRLGDRDANRLQDGFSHFDADDLRRLSVGEAICRVGASDSDFSLNCQPSAPQNNDNGDRRSRAIRLSRDSYAVPQALLDTGADADEVAKGPPGPRPAARSRASRAPEPETDAVPSPALLEAQPAERPAEPPSQEASQPAQEENVARTPGRGGPHHKLMQQLIKQHANGLGLRATVEMALPDSDGSVDVLVVGQSLKIAFEFADCSPLEQEVRNIEKALASGIEAVVVVSASKPHLEEIRTAALARGVAVEGQVTFLESSEIGGYFSALGAGLASYETTSRGYKVRVRHADISEQEREERLAAIHRAIAQHQREAAQGDKE